MPMRALLNTLAVDLDRAVLLLIVLVNSAVLWYVCRRRLLCA